MKLRININRILIMYILFRSCFVMFEGSQMFSFPVLLAIFALLVVINFKSLCDLPNRRSVIFLLFAIGWVAFLQFLTPTSFQLTTQSIITQGILVLMYIVCIDINGLRSDKNSIIVLFFLIGTIVSALYTLRVTGFDSTIIRNTASGGGVLKTGETIASFSFAYMLVISSSIITGYLLNEKFSRVRRNLLIGWIAVALAFILYSGYTTAALLFIVSAILQSVLGGKMKIRNVMVLIIVFLALSYAMKNIDNITTQRISTMLSTRDTTDVIGFAGRENVTQAVVNAFLKHPILGQIIGNGDCVTWNHNLFLDWLAWGGLLGVLPIVLFFWCFVIESLKTCGDSATKRRIFTITFAIFVLLGIVNSMNLSTAMLPLLLFVSQMTNENRSVSVEGYK